MDSPNQGKKGRCSPEHFCWSYDRLFGKGGSVELGESLAVDVVMASDSQPRRQLRDELLRVDQKRFVSVNKRIPSISTTSLSTRLDNQADVGRNARRGTEQDQSLRQCAHNR